MLLGRCPGEGCANAGGKTRRPRAVPGGAAASGVGQGGVCACVGGGGGIRYVQCVPCACVRGVLGKPLATAQRPLPAGARRHRGACPDGERILGVGRPLSRRLAGCSAPRERGRGSFLSSWAEWLGPISGSPWRRECGPPVLSFPGGAKSAGSGSPLEHLLCAAPILRSAAHRRARSLLTPNQCPVTRGP